MNHLIVGLRRTTFIFDPSEIELLGNVQVFDFHTFDPLTTLHNHSGILLNHCA